LRQGALMFAANSGSARRQNFALPGKEISQSGRVFKIYLLDIFLAKIAGFFHSLGLLKTEQEKRKEEQKKLELKLEKERLKRKLLLEKQRLRREKLEKIRRFFSKNLGLFKTTQEIEEEHRRKLELKIEREKAARAQEREKERIKEQKREAINYHHAMQHRFWVSKRG